MLQDKILISEKNVLSMIVLQIKKKMFYPNFFFNFGFIVALLIFLAAEFHFTYNKLPYQ